MVGETVNNTTDDSTPKKLHSLDQLEGRIENNKSQLLTLSQLLCGKTIFIIPDYQRGYAWNKEARDLWYDIMRIYDLENGSKKHYTGLLVLNQIDPSSETEGRNIKECDRFYVVDGQQRLTTLFIFLSFILRQLGKGDSTYLEIDSVRHTKRFMYSKKRNDGAQKFFEEYVYNFGKSTPDDVYKKNIQDTCGFISKELHQFDHNGLQRLADVILNQIVFNVFCDFYDVPDEDKLDVRMTFETMNNRGKQLSILELLKNRMMYLIYNSANQDEQSEFAEQIDTDWNIIYQNLSLINIKGNSQKPFYAKDETFVMAHWYVCHGTSKANSYVYAEEIFDTFSLTKVLSGEITIKQILDYCDCLTSYSAYWAIVNYPEKNMDFAIKRGVKMTVLEYLCELNCLNINLYVRALLMVVLQKDPEEIDKKDAFFKNLVNFIFLNVHILNVKNDLSPFITVSNKYIGIKEPKKLNDFYDDLNDRIEKEGPDGFDFSFGNWKKNKDDFKNALENKFISEHLKHGFYTNSWSGIQYFLFKYNQIQCPQKYGNPITYHNLSNTSIEHIFPQTSDKSDYWKRVFELSYPKLTDHVEIKEQKDLLKNMLGNLVLITGTDENASLSNRCYPIKSGNYIHPKYDCNEEKDVKATYERSSSSAYEIFSKYKFYWLPNDIEDRTITLMDFLYERWLCTYITKDEWDGLYKDKLHSKIQCKNGLININDGNHDDDLNTLDLSAKNEISDLPDKKNSTNGLMKQKKYGDELINRFNCDEFHFYKNRAVHTKPGKDSLNVEGVYVVVDKLKDDGTGLIDIFTKDRTLKINEGNIEIGYNTNNKYVYLQSNKYHDKPSPITEDDYNNLGPKVRRFIYVFVEFIREKFGNPVIDIRFEAEEESLESYTLDQFIEAVFVGLRNLGGTGSNEDIKKEVIKYLKISEIEKNILHTFKSGNNNMSQLDYMLTWAKSYLGKYAGIIENASRGLWKINESYKNLEKVNGNDIIRQTRKTLK